MTNNDETLDTADFRRKAIADLEDLKNRYLTMVRSNGKEENKLKGDRLERAVRLLPGLLKTEENFLSSTEEANRREKLEAELEPLFAVLEKVIGPEFEQKRDEIIAALEAELK
ncbi:hypothetical protein GF359_06400 [candidate division WOR-3 bacterium]|uniref:Uncharacterized protein n=1 Tax=candidate division WOR-3 bacterium TaxID=2052148 RepID=A0A9D5QCR0_UNCW3|nr:hypothetical protein [candidate division WOR-3 bacterium]MBD3364829.1 hypothetical protein [candidate division WOR-3 bacterium]